MMSFRKFHLLATGFSLLLILFSCKGKPATDQGKTEVSAVEISIKGMTCTGCEQTIKGSITKLDGIQSVTASFTDGKATVVYLPGKTDTANMRKAITDKGYGVNKFTVVPSERITD